MGEYKANILILDTTEVLVALNLDSEPRDDYIVIDGNLNNIGQRMIDFLDLEKEFFVEQAGS